MSKFLMKLKKGMIMNTKYNNFFSKTIAMGLGNYWTHTAWVRDIQGDKIFIQEALGSKTKKVTTSEYNIKEIEAGVKNNIMSFMDFKINGESTEFKKQCELLENLPYDYYSIFELTITRIGTLFGINMERFMAWTILGKQRIKLNPDFSSEKKVDCSEAIGRSIAKLTKIDVLKLLNKKKFDLVTPQDISNLYLKLRLMGEI